MAKKNVIPFILLVLFTVNLLVLPAWCGASPVLKNKVTPEDNDNPLVLYTGCEEDDSADDDLNPASQTIHHFCVDDMEGISFSPAFCSNKYEARYAPAMLLSIQNLYLLHRILRI